MSFRSLPVEVRFTIFAWGASLLLLSALGVSKLLDVGWVGSDLLMWSFFAFCGLSMFSLMQLSTASLMGMGFLQFSFRSLFEPELRRAFWKKYRARFGISRHPPAWSRSKKP